MKFSDLFPTPRFLEMREAGVSISERVVRYVSFRPGSNGELILVKNGEIPLDEGVISSGEVMDKQKLANALSKLRKEHGIRFVSATIPEERSYLFTTSVEKVSYEDLDDAVAFTIEENAPVSLADSLFAFEMIDKKDEFGVAVSVLPISVAEEYIDAFELAGITPISFDIESQAIARALVKRGDDRSHLIIYLGKRKVGFYLVHDEVEQFSSIQSIDLSGSAVSPEAMQALKAELRKFFSFWSAKHEENGMPNQKVEHIIIGGPGASDEKVVASIMSDIETPYSVANVWTNVCSLEKHLPQIPFDVSLSYAATIGTALKRGKKAYV